jgi:diaminohydroxyphosphoribosylaminopyrimidine deaminase/5-amino-6-(5-phosphoribosylamino)uracil reductase
MSIMVGTNTALNDDPLLTARHWSGRDPIRIILDRTLRLPNTLRIFDGEVPTIFLNSEKESSSKNIRYVLIDQQTETQASDESQHNPGNEFIEQLITAIARQNITSVLVEGGQQLLQSFIDAGYWDEARIIKNCSKFIGHGIAAPALTAAQLFSSHLLQNDEVLYLHNPLNSYLNTTGK